MIPKLKPFLLGTIFGAALLYVGLQYHLVRSSRGFFLVPRVPQAPLGLAYADIRHMREGEWRSRPELARAMAAHNARQVLKDRREQAAAAAAAEDDFNPAEDLPEMFNNMQQGSGDKKSRLWNPFGRDDEPGRDETPFREITDTRTSASDQESLRPSFELANETHSTDDIRTDEGLPPATNSRMTRRAREIYERSRARRSESFDDPLLQQRRSRAGSVIDELVSPRQQRQAADLIDRAAEQMTPGRYMRQDTPGIR